MKLYPMHGQPYLMPRIKATVPFTFFRLLSLPFFSRPVCIFMKISNGLVFRCFKHSRPALVKCNWNTTDSCNFWLFIKMQHEMNLFGMMQEKKFCCILFSVEFWRSFNVMLIEIRRFKMKLNGFKRRTSFKKEIKNSFIETGEKVFILNCKKKNDRSKWRIILFALLVSNWKVDLEREKFVVFDVIMPFWLISPFSMIFRAILLRFTCFFSFVDLFFKSFTKKWQHVKQNPGHECYTRF